jgi:hypothetical protein
MAISLKPATGIQVIVAVPGTVVAASPPPFENTHTIVVLNTSAGDGYVNWQTGAAAMGPTTAMVIPGGGSLTLAVGPESQRPMENVDIIFLLQFDGAGATTFQITYVNGVDL